MRILNLLFRIRTWVLRNTKGDNHLRLSYTVVGHILNPLKDSSIEFADILSDSQSKPIVCNKISKKLFPSFKYNVRKGGPFLNEHFCNENRRGI